MDLVHYIVLTFLFRVTAGVGFFISDDETDWETATKQCQLAEPDLIFSSGRVTVNIAVDVDEDVWIGYYQATTAFEYFGCAAKDSNIPKFYTQADPGQCMSACGADKIIGIFGNECFCFETEELLDKEQTMLPNCNKQCDNLKGVVCGGSSMEIGGTTYISLYRSLGTDFASTGERQYDENCMYYVLREFNWGLCTKKYAFLCGTGNTSWIENNTKDVYKVWSDATITCFAHKTRPSTYNNTQSLQKKQSTRKLWTGIMRSQVIYKYTNIPLHLERADGYGYVTSSNALKLSHHDYTRKSLCVDDLEFGDRFYNISYAEVSTEEDGGVLFQDSSDVGTIVGATLSVIALIVIVICLFLYGRKRGFHQPCQERQASPHIVQNDHAYVNTQPDVIVHSSVDTNNPEYAEINEATLPEDGAQVDVMNNDTTTSPVYSNDYFVIEKKACESTKPENLKSDPNQPYEKLSLEESPNYENYGNVQA